MRQIAQTLRHKLATPKALTLLLFASHAALALIFVFYRFVDWDEGFYLMAGRSIADGLRLYLDFFHPQAPVYPHLLANLTHGGWEMLFQARVVNALFSLVTMALVTLCVMRLKAPGDVQSARDKRAAALTAMFLYSCSGLFLSWNTVAKPLALSQLFAAFAFYACLRAKDQSAIRTIVWALLAGAGAILSAQTRLPLLVLWPFFFAHLLLAREARHKGLAALAFLTGSHFAAIPSIVMCLSDWRRFLYNNLGFHMARDVRPDLSEMLYDKLRTVTKLLIDPQLLIILIITLTALWLARRKLSPLEFLRDSTFLALTLGSVTLVAYLQAYPSLRQYAVQALPFYIIFAGAAAPTVIRELQKRFGARVKRFIGTVLGIYAAGALPYFAIYFVTVRGYDKKSVQSRVEQVVETIQKNTAGDGVVFAESPIYPLLAKRRALALTEFVGFQYRSLGLDGRYLRMNLPDTMYLQKQVADAKPEVVVIDNKPDPGLAVRLAERYELIFSDDYTQVYRRNDTLHKVLHE